MTVDKTMRFRVSSRLDSEFNNGVDYYRYDGKPLQVVPSRPEERAPAEYLGWHSDVVFRP